MKFLIYIVAFALMFWALMEQTKPQPNIYVQIIAVIVFFFLMMYLMNKTPSNSNEDNNQTNNEQGN